MESAVKISISKINSLITSNNNYILCLCFVISRIRLSQYKDVLGLFSAVRSELIDFCKNTTARTG